jgi:hypothetical protein
MANGKGERDTTLRDARKLNLVPSVTTILGLINQDGLNRWKLNEVLEATMVLPWDIQKTYPGITSKNKLYIELVKLWKYKIVELSKKKGKEAANIGDQIHNALEQYYLGGGLHPDFEEYCRPVIDLIHSKFGNLEWVPEASFSHPLGFGGKCDLHMQPCGEFPHGVIIDFKTKSAEDFSKVKAYDEQCQQLVAYREGFNIPKAECYNLFISNKQPGALLLHKWTEEQCQKAWKCFSYLVEYWKTSNNI